MPILNQDNPSSSDTFHAKLGQLYARDLDRERAVHFGADAVLRVFKVLPSGRTQIGSDLTSGWSAYDQEFEGAEQWVLEVIEAGFVWASVRAGAEVELVGHVAGQRFRIMSVSQPIEAGHGWIIRMEPIERI